MKKRSIFLSTCPVRGTTLIVKTMGKDIVISIHVPREGHDNLQRYPARSNVYFYPRAP